MLRLTVPLNPFCGVTAKLYVAAAPRDLTDALEGEAEIEKSGAITTSVAAVPCTKLPLVPVIVNAEGPGGVVLIVWIVRVEKL